jgi:hypothetical protein
MRHAASRRRRAVGLVTLVAGGASYWYRSRAPDSALAAKVTARAGVPMSVAVAARQDVPSYLSGPVTVSVPAAMAGSGRNS